MADVLIHRCTLRVVRRGGWSWGPDPKRLLQDVVRSFPELLARKLETLFPDEEDREFAAPIRLRIPIRMSDLLPDPTVAGSADFPAASRTIASVEEKLDGALRRFFGVETGSVAGSTSRGRFASADADADEKNAWEECRGIGAVARALMRWHRSGVLENRLAALGDHELESWHRAVWLQVEEWNEPAPEAVSSIEEQGLALATSHEKSFGRDVREDRLRLRLLVAAALAEHIQIPLASPRLLAALNRILPVEDRATAGPVITTGNAPVAAETKSAETWNSGPKRESAPFWEVQVDCALPFLLLGPLSKLGYFEGLAAVLEAADLSDKACLFAAALAYKVLEPPERGWRRSPSSVQTASAFAGMQEAVPNDALVEFSRQIARHTEMLDWTLTESVVRGHTPGSPILLRRADTENSTGFLLIDTSGCFPIAWNQRAEPLLPVLGRLGNSIVLVSREAAGPRVLQELDRAGVSFVSDVLPTRSEAWRRIQQGPVQLGWTNHAAPESVAVLEAARILDAAVEEATQLWETLAGRPGVIRASLPQLDCSLMLAASVAAGMIAWQLWRGRGRTTPSMVVERFCDLDGRVRFSPNSVNVRLPLGRRHQELLNGGFLNPASGVPWFGDRQVELGGG